MNLISSSEIPMSSADMYWPSKRFKKLAYDLNRWSDLWDSWKIIALPPPNGIWATLFLWVIPRDKRNTSFKPCSNESYSLNLHPPIAGPFEESWIATIDLMPVLSSS